MSENARKISSLGNTRELSTKVEILQQLWEKLCFVNWSSNAFQSMRQHIAGLVIQCKAFGNQDAASTATNFVSYLDKIIESGQVPDETQRYQISQLIFVLKSSILINHDNLNNNSKEATQQSNENNTFSKLDNRNDKLIYIVDDDEVLAEYISLQLASSGYLIQLFNNPEEMLLDLEIEKPAAILMDVVFPDSQYSGIDAAKIVTEHTDYIVPVMLMSGRTDMSARIQAIRVGSAAYFTKPIDVTAVINKLDEILLHNDNEPSKVLVVSDDAGLSAYCADVLKLEGINSIIVVEPLKIIQYIRSFSPDLVLMDVELNSCKGTELSAVIRQEPDLKYLPVVYLSSEVEPGKLQSTLSQLGDEYLTKPIDEEEMVCVVRRNIERIKRLAIGSVVNKKIDPEVGLVNLKNFMADVDVAVLSCVNDDKKKSVLWLRFDQLEKIYREVGAGYSNSIIRQISYAIRSCLSENDHITKFNDSVFAILTIPREPAVTRELANSICEKINSLSIKITNRSFNLNCNIGISHVHPLIHSSKKLLAEAENACFHASDASLRPGSDSSGSVDATLRKNNVVQYCSHIESLSDTNIYAFPHQGIEKGLRENNFSLVFQPILSIGEKKEELYEVLVRMLGEEGDLLLPAEFLPIASDKGVMHEVDRWVIDHAITKLSDDFHARSHANLFIKLSNESLNDKMLITWISNCLKNSRIRGLQRVFFELNEAAVAENMKVVKEFTKSIKNLGCGIVLDHFGSSEQSLKILNELPVDYVKVQSQSINEISENKELRVRYEGLIRSALQQCDDVIVGAVENPHNLSLIWDWGVRYVQGYFIQPPYEDLLFDFENTINFK